MPIPSGAFDSERVPFLSTSGVIVDDHLLDHSRGRRRLEEDVHLPSLDLRQVEDVIDQPEQVLAGAVDLLAGRRPRLAGVLIGPSSCSISL